MMNRIVFLLMCLATGATAFVVQPPSRTTVVVEAQRNKFMEIATTAAIAFTPLAALAEEVDNYEYGAVDAPIGVAVGAGILAILTALLPLVLQGGEEAFEEMKEQDKDKWGSSKSADTLKKKKR